MNKINSLTSLRFIAAAMIVVHHSRTESGKLGSYLGSFALDHGVSFFFVLSGFILSYVYSNLNTKEEVCRFYLARFARVWPAHLFTFILVLFLFPSNKWNWISVGSYDFLLVGFSNLSLLHAWIPLNYYYFSFNAVSWSVSAEFFFYLCFPFLIYKWKETWLVKLIFSISLVLGIIFLCNVLTLPGFSIEYRSITNHSLLFISPLVRIFEFIIGMTVLFFWRKYRNKVRISMTSATVLEFIVIVLTLFSLRYSHFLGEFGSGTLGNAWNVWVEHSGSCLIFAILIFVMAFEKGYISNLLSFPLPVLLGEISFSIYLTHQIILRYYAEHFFIFPSIPPLIKYLSLWIVILCVSYLIWYFIERPSRKFIIGLWPKKNAFSS